MTPDADSGAHIQAPRVNGRPVSFSNSTQPGGYQK